MKQGETTESQVKGEIHERMTNNQKRRSPEFPEIEYKQIHIPRKLTGVPGCVRTVGTDSNSYLFRSLFYVK